MSRGAVVRDRLSVFLKALPHALGVEVYRRRSHHHYVLDYFGHRSHKQADIRKLEPFASLARQVIEEGRTLLYYDRLHILYQALENLARQVAEDREVHLAEVGVFRGGTSKFLALAARSFGLRFRLHCFDTFAGHSGLDVAEGVDGGQYEGAFAATQWAAVRDYLGGFPEITLYQGRVQETACRVEGLPFHFLHLDVDIHGPTLYCLERFGSRLALGGMVVVDDYQFLSTPGARKAVDDFMAGNGSFACFTPITAQAILVKVAEYRGR